MNPDIIPNFSIVQAILAPANGLDRVNQDNALIQADLLTNRFLLQKKVAS